MATYGGNVKVCATCTYWGGTRSVTNLGSNIEVNNYEKGPCNYEKKRGVQMTENMSCQWQRKWSALR